MAKDKTDEELLQLDYIISLSLDKGEITSMVLNATPEEEPSASRMVPQMVSVARRNNVVALKDSGLALA